ncbi:PREDICTED: NACHT%2C LRR and PYD domains-containing protein 3-like [Xyrichtys novacula]|uniref:PREDICTED: NACHT, LRR and PYD domains-containing protein 3-like n=1 Tax=Xyrichtys novacula TaxID=13765 RepID=A0AAV1EYZ2_XYRNO|nr:PREDICTED: NACHT%2C LRR and PYD domains-containing protein 3-like [Xyrichtys novacula]
MTTKMDLVDILDEMSDEDFERFKWFLEETHIPKHKLQSANRTAAIDLLVGRLTMDKVTAVVRKALMNVQRNDLAMRLKRPGKV